MVISVLFMLHSSPILKQGKHGLDAYVALPICRIQESVMLMVI